MAVKDIGMLFQFIGGLGMFLYGMHVMAEGLQQSAAWKDENPVRVFDE